MQYLLYGTALLAADSLVLGRVPAGAALDGETLIDAFTPFGADHAIVYGRGRGERTYSVTVTRLFSTPAAAKLWLLTHEDTLPLQADLTIADNIANWAVVMAGAVVQARIRAQIGAAVTVDYTFTGARFESDDVPEIPTDDSTVKTLVIDLDENDTEKAVVFATAFGAAPKFVRGEIAAPDSGEAVFAVVRESTRTAAGVTFDFTAAIPGAGYKLLVLAVL